MAINDKSAASRRRQRFYDIFDCFVLSYGLSNAMETMPDHCDNGKIVSKAIAEKKNNLKICFDWGLD